MHATDLLVFNNHNAWLLSYFSRYDDDDDDDDDDLEDDPDLDDDPDFLDDADDDDGTGAGAGAGARAGMGEERDDRSTEVYTEVSQTPIKRPPRPMQESKHGGGNGTNQPTNRINSRIN